MNQKFRELTETWIELWDNRALKVRLLLSENLHWFEFSDDNSRFLYLAYFLIFLSDAKLNNIT